MVLMSRAMVQTGTRQLEMREFPVPEIGDDDGLLKIEVCGICGSDWAQYQGEYNGFVTFPVIPGHEPVGIIDRIGRNAARRWGVKEGDRVVVEPVLPCGYCKQCVAGRANTCTGRGDGGVLPYYAYIPIDVAPTLWGGYADYLYLAPTAQVHRIDSSIEPNLAAMYNPLGSGVHWAIHNPGTQVSDTIVILGCGQRGLCSVIAARDAGCSLIVVTGLRRDQHKMELAKLYGAHHVVYADEVDVVAEIKKILPEGADIVLDTTPSAPQSVAHAIDIAAPYGTISLAGMKGSNLANGVNSDTIIHKSLRLLGTKGVPWRANEAAIRMIESRKYPLEKMHTHTIGLEDVDYALRLLAGEIPGEQAIHITIKP